MRFLLPDRAHAHAHVSSCSSCSLQKCINRVSAPSRVIQMEVKGTFFHAAVVRIDIGKSHNGKTFQFPFRSYLHPVVHLHITLAADLAGKHIHRAALRGT